MSTGYSPGFPQAIHSLTDEELYQLCSWSPPASSFKAHRDSLVIKTFCFCGLRREELRSLDRQNFILKFGRPWIRFIGKGARIREVPVPLPLFKSIQASWTSHSDSNFTPAFSTFPHFARRIGYSNLWRIVTGRTNEILGFPVHPHVLRHTAATGWLKKGANLRTVMALLGHTSLATTTRYLHSSSDDLIAAVESISEPLTYPVELRLFDSRPDSQQLSKKTATGGP